MIIVGPVSTVQELIDGLAKHYRKIVTEQEQEHGPCTDEFPAEANERV